MADIRLANPNADSEQLAAIYYPYVINTAITFDTVPVKGHSFRDRITKSMTVYPWVVCEHEKEIMGYAHGGQFRDKDAFKWTVETTIYVKEAAHGLGIGKSLYKTLMNCLKLQNFGLCIGVITLPNHTSENLHESLGFTRRAVIRKAGYKLGRWHDVGIWTADISDHGNNPAPPIVLPEIRGNKRYLEQISKYSNLIKI